MSSTNQLSMAMWNIQSFGLTDKKCHSLISSVIYSLKLDFITLQDIIPKQTSTLPTPSLNCLAQDLLHSNFPNVIASMYVAFIPMSPRITIKNHCFLNDDLPEEEHGQILQVDILMDEIAPLRVIAVYLLPKNADKPFR